MNLSVMYLTAFVGEDVGFSDGAGVGFGDGAAVGAVGAAVGETVGVAVGAAVGVAVGAVVKLKELGRAGATETSCEMNKAVHSVGVLSSIQLKQQRLLGYCLLEVALSR